MAINQPDTEQNIEFEISSGNIFADIGFENAQEMLLKSELVRQVNRTIKDRDLNSMFNRYLPQLIRKPRSRQLENLAVNLCSDQKCQTHSSPAIADRPCLPKRTTKK